jgi:hypothetical protein
VCVLPSRLPPGASRVRLLAWQASSHDSEGPHCEFQSCAVTRPLLTIAYRDRVSHHWAQYSVQPIQSILQDGVPVARQPVVRVHPERLAIGLPPVHCRAESTSGGAAAPPSSGRWGWVQCVDA